MDMMDMTAATSPTTGRTGDRGFAWAAPALAVPALLLFGAHLMRSGHHAFTACCVLWALFCLLRRSWARPVTALALAGMGCAWFMTAGRLMELRLAFGEPWLRMTCIVGGCAVLALAAAAAVWAGPGRRWFCREPERALPRACAFGLVVLLMAPTLFMQRPMLLADRLLPGMGHVQILLAACWGCLVCGRLSDPKAAQATRLRAWPLFSIVFFGQFALSALGCAVLSMTGQWHVPVPGVILGGAIYRMAPGFMLFLFLFSVLLAGAAWCSHLCYFGSWDALAATRGPATRHPGPLRWRVLSLALTAAAALALRGLGAPTEVAAACGVALGVAMAPVALLCSRRRRIALYCTAICPLGLVACLLGRLSPWRLRVTPSCTGCGRCLTRCRYGALDRQRLAAGGPGLSCTLCRECEHACPHGGLAMSLAGRGLPRGDGSPGWAGQAFACLVSAMHAAFLFMAMV